MSTTRGRRSKAQFNPFLAALLVLVAALGSLITLESLGKIDLGLKQLWGGSEVSANVNMVPVLIATRAAQPGDEVGSTHVWDSTTGGQKFVPISKRAVEEKHYATGLSQISGRVLADFKAPGEPFVPTDFLPVGTKPGLSGLVPPGMELVFLSNDRFVGIDQLRFGDRFDLLMTIPADPEVEKAAKESLESRSRVTPEERIRFATSKPQPHLSLVAQHGVVLRAGIESGRKSKRTAVALHPDDVQPTLDAQSGELDVYCRLRGEDDLERIEQPRYEPTATYDWVVDEVGEVEVIQGRDGSTVTAPRPRGAESSPDAELAVRPELEE